MPIMSHTTHQVRLIPLLARTVALEFATRKLSMQHIEVMQSGDPVAIKELHILSAGIAFC